MDFLILTTWFGRRLGHDGAVGSHEPRGAWSPWTPWAHGAPGAPGAYGAHGAHGAPLGHLNTWDFSYMGGHTTHV